MFVSLRLRTKLQLLTTGTVTILTAVVLIVFSLLARREIERAVVRDVQTTGRLLGQKLNERSATLFAQCKLLAQQPAFRCLEAVRSAPGARADEVALTMDDFAVRELLRPLGADVVVVTDQDGFLLVETDHPGRAAQTPPMRTAARGIRAALAGKTWVGIAARGDRLMQTVSVPAVDPVSGAVRMTLTAFKAIDATLARDLKDATSSDVAFVKGQTIVGASLPGLPRRVPTPEDAPTLLTLNGERYLALYAVLPRTDLNVGLGFLTLYPQRRATVLFVALRDAFVVVSGTALILALAVGGLFARGVTRPLDLVVEAARTLREGGWPARFEVRPGADDIGLLQATFNDMTDSLRQGQERLLALIDTDPLTNLDNHRRFQETLTQETTRAESSGEPLSLLLVDLDHFHAYNQHSGHAAGDAALQTLADLLRPGGAQGTISPVALAARYGGEEFAVLLPRHDIDQAEAVAEALRETTRAAFNDTLSVSIGCATLGAAAPHAEGLAMAAELAMSQAKQLGRDRVCRFEGMPSDDAHASGDTLHLHEFSRDGSLTTIQALAAAVDAKDPYTQGHSRRVAEYASDLARRLGLSKADIDLIYITGTLHDVGKIGVPDSVLKKPGRLDEEERAVMETHPALGEVIVRKVPALAAALPGVRHHHERWDGNGYPDKLAGEEIPFLGRILAVADTFDAMASDRPYRAGMAVMIALDEIERNAGVQFDPRLASAFVAMMREVSDTASAA